MEHVVPARHDEATSNLVAAAGRAREFKRYFSRLWPPATALGRFDAASRSRQDPVECRRPRRNAPVTGAVYGSALTIMTLRPVPESLGRSRPPRPGARSRLNAKLEQKTGRKSGPLQGAPGQWPGPSPGANSPLDCLRPGSACSTCPPAAARGGARACRPRCVRIFSMTGCSRIAAMIFSSPPQFGPCSRSRSKRNFSADSLVPKLCSS